MATCRNCVHSCVCFDGEGTTRYYGKELAANNVEQLCRNYKDRARFVEVVRCKDCIDSAMYSHGRFCESGGHYVEDNFYCANGERKDNDI